MASYATEFARRGYVAISVDYRTLHSLSRDDPRPIRDAMLAGYDNAVAALAFVHEHADHYRIDHEAIAVGGAEAGAVNAFDLAYLPGEHARTGSNDIAAALAIAGVSLGSPDAGDAPLMAFNASEDLTAPLHMAQWTCADAVEVDAHCESVAYQGNPGNLEFAKQRDIVRRSALFLADEVLRPLGYIDDGHATTTTTGNEHTTTTGAGASTTSTTTHGGNLPKTGSDSTMPLLLVGLVLSGVGAGLVFLARRRRDGRGGGGGLPGAVAGLLLIAVALPALGRDGSSASAQEVPPADEPTTTVPDDTSTTLPPTTVDPSTTSTTRHQHPTSSVPGTSTTMGSTTTTHHGGGDPGFPSDWTPDQVAYATKLIDDTEMSLERFDTQAVLPLMGYTWIFDGTAVGSYQHWINVYRIGFSDSTIDTSRPESLVYRQTEDGPVLEAAMYILGANFVGVDSVPEDLAWLPDWHVHDNLCAEGFPPRLVGLTDENGQCTRGYKLTTPPMLHVWIVDTECGRFAGVDENGLICHHHPED
jgi:LPXTG-motif cell wall-anchored protein